ncbi:MAG TPA: hypothetical protein VHZ03_34585 [Trebonia sp.]|nr:hypothetical protein [Trebonia sp.]
MEPRGYERDGFEVTLWTCHQPVTPQISAAGYAQALQRLHAGLAMIDVPAPHVTDRVADVPGHVASTPAKPCAKTAAGSSWRWWPSTAVIP